MDLGFPVYKPDRWLVRFAATDASCKSVIAKLLDGVSVEQADEKYLERHLDIVCHAVDALRDSFMDTPDGIVNLDEGFLRHRFVDLVLSKFGMEPESSFGLVTSGKEFLLAERNSDSRKDFPALHDIAVAMKRASDEQQAAKRAANLLKKQGLRVCRRCKIACSLSMFARSSECYGRRDHKHCAACRQSSSPTRGEARV
ncbi:hypothetical protein [Paraburkholderia sp. C35]|uniref:hypothetical protein n=1 Tax=Paraburkholderia sp. C35 TaxID=2126993 RepID=UPI000D69F3FF|nr:hypothetical protein [Paraburkholderia sp. C35]